MPESYNANIFARPQHSEKKENEIKVLVIESRELLRNGVTALLRKVDGINLIGNTGNTDEVISLVERYRPDVVVMDIQLPGIGGIELIKMLRRKSKKTRIIVCAGYTNNVFSRRLFSDFGVVGYLTKSCSVDELTNAIFKVGSGGQYIASVMCQQDELDEEHVAMFESLTRRELQILIMLIDGKRIKEISNLLNINPKTLNGYRKALHKKVHVSNDAGLIGFALNHGFNKYV